MPFDENGIYQEDQYRSPQTGAMAGVNILNQVQSYGNYRRTRETELLKQMLALHAAGQGGADVADTEGGSNAMGVLGIDPANVQRDFYNSGPEQFKRGFAEMDPSTTDPEDVVKLGGTTGGTSPAQTIAGTVNVFGKRNQQTREATREGAVHVAEMAAIQKNLQKAFDRNLQTTGDQGQAAELAAQQVVSSARLVGREFTTKQLQGIQDWVEAQRGMKIGGLLGEKTKLAGAQAAGVKKHTELAGQPKEKPKKLDPEAAVQKHKDLREDLKDAKKRLAEATKINAYGAKNLATKEAEMAAAKAEIASIEKKLAAEDEDEAPGAAKKKGPFTPGKPYFNPSGKRFVADANGNEP